MQAVWPLSPTATYFSPHLQPAGPLPPSIQYTNKPRVGLGVICICQPQKYGVVECLLLKRGPKFVSPLKWSFPGGRLDEEGDLEDDGERGTLRELKKECGGGAPHGLPPLIHIECYKSGRTLYHVYVLDTESQTSWLRWQPSKTLDHTGEIDTSARELILQGRSFTAYNGFCWVDLQILFEECMTINVNDTDVMSGNQLQHGLIRWVRSNGENILKTLLARSPNLAYQRRYSSTSASSTTSLPPSSHTSHTNNNNNNRGIPQSANRIQLTPSRWLHPSLDMPRPPLLPSAGMYQYPTGIPTLGGTQAGASGTPGGDNNSMGVSAGSEQQQLQMLLNQAAVAQQQLLNDSASSLRNDNSLETSFDTSSYTSPDSAPLMTTPPYDVSGGGGGASPRKPRRYELCRYYMISGGQCPFGEKCWFVHPGDGKNRGDMGGVHPIPQVWHPGGFVMDQFGQPHPQTGNSPYRPPPGGGFLPMMRPPGGFPPQGGAGAMMFRPYVFPGQFYNRPMGPGGVPMGLPPQQYIQSVTDPVLRFKLLSELQVGGAPGTHLSETTQLSVRADHFYLSLNETLRDYRILFGGDRSFNDSSSLSAEQNFSCKVSCLHCSRMQTLLVIIGLENGSIYCWDPRNKNNNNGTTSQLNVVHEATKVESPVTALTHFSTTIEGAQVVVSGDIDGNMTWFIAQPPMKIFSLLSTANTHSPHKVVSFQIFGGCLISGGNDGTVCLWNMRSQEPSLADKIQAHSTNLLDIYVLDASTFLTVGLNSTSTTTRTSSDPTTTSDHITTNNTASSDVPQPTTYTTATGGPSNNSSGGGGMMESVDSLAVNMSNVSLLPSPTSFPTSLPVSTSSYSASIWEYTKSSVTNVKTIDNLGEVLVSAFHQQPMFGNQFLALGFQGGAVKIYNLPNFSVASEIHFPDISSHPCRHVALNLSREKEQTLHFNMRNPFRDLLLTTVWGDGRVMICQIEPLYKGGGGAGGGANSSN